MDESARERALDRLPVASAVAVRLRARGQDDAAIADTLGVDAAAVPAMMEVAEAKLRRLVAEES